nr:MAG TPA: hypothetical protein [Caudoviricetes sp.]
MYKEAALKSCLKASGFLGASDTGAPITRAGVSKAGRRGSGHKNARRCVLKSG